uniref:Uncharacterized protein n=1 Tax=viral metagenome TaxID=1070528 RepID=A0A6C0C8Q8_9ZZZZ
MNKNIRVKILCNWTNSKQICQQLNNNVNTLKHIEITWLDTDIDYYFIFNSPFNGELFQPNKTILIKTNNAPNIYEHEPLNFLKIIPTDCDLESINFLNLLEGIIYHLEGIPYESVQVGPDTLTYQRYFTNITKPVKHICFLHCCSIGHASRMILNQIVSKVLRELINELDYLYIVNIGENIVETDFINEKIRIINYSNNTQLFEKPTLNLMRCFSKYHQDAKILYLHTKGITYPSDYVQISDWRNLLIFFLVERYRTCLKLLDEYDVVGSNFSLDPHPHFSGNFWWSTSKHINTLPEIISNVRHDCEWWLFNNNPNVKKSVLYTSNVNHYTTPYPTSIYDPDAINEK